MRKVLMFALSGLLISQLCLAAGNSRITLNDGTTIIGKVTGMQDGVYTIHTEKMGDINVNSDDVLEISSNTGSNSQRSKNIEILDGNPNKNSSGSSSAGNNLAQQQEEVNNRVKSMTMNEDFLESLMGLGESSSMQSVLEDEEVMNAIANNDYDFLMNNSKMNDLMNSSEIQDILGDM